MTDALRQLQDAANVLADKGLRTVKTDDICQAVYDAINEVERLRAENGRLREALKYYAENHYPNVNEGPWGVNSSDFGDVARTALGEEEK
jgi:hypothetical protein